MKRIPFQESRYVQAFQSEEAARRYATKHAKAIRMLARKGAKVLRGLGLEKGRVLDAGSASGDAIFDLASEFPECSFVGLDVYEPFVEMGSAKAEELGLRERVSFVAGDAEAMPFEDDAFDAVVSLNTLHCVNDPVKMLDECERVLHPNGVCVHGIPRRGLLAYVEGAFRTSFTPKEVEQILRASRLRRWKVDTGIIYMTVLAGDRG